MMSERISVDDLERLYEIEQEMLALLSEAEDIVAHSDGGRQLNRARAYWIAQIRMALNNDHEYLGSASCSMRDTTQELEGLNEPPFDPELDGEDGRGSWPA
jgi:hypothetical protein